MFGTNLLEHRSKPERIADQAWEHLVSAVTSVGDTARGGAADAAHSAKRGTSHFAGGASDLVGSASDEARHRARAAIDALAGRRPSTPWLLIVGAGLLGAAIGWAAASAARTAIARDEMSGEVSPDGHRLEFIDTDRPQSRVGTDT